MNPSEAICLLLFFILKMSARTLTKYNDSLQKSFLIECKKKKILLVCLHVCSSAWLVDCNWKCSQAQPKRAPVTVLYLGILTFELVVLIEYNGNCCFSALHQPSCTLI